MVIFIITFIFMLIMAGGMAIGLIIKNKEIHGSCGGIAGLGMKKVCNCENPCDKKQAKMAAEAQEKKIAEREKNRII